MVRVCQLVRAKGGWVYVELPVGTRPTRLAKARAANKVNGSQRLTSR